MGSSFTSEYPIITTVVTDRGVAQSWAYCKHDQHYWPHHSSKALIDHKTGNVYLRIVREGPCCSNYGFLARNDFSLADEEYVTRFSREQLRLILLALKDINYEPTSRDRNG